MKRLLSLSLILPILVLSLAFPAGAIESDADSLINLLEYCTANDSGSNYINPGSAEGSFYYDSGIGITFRYIDMLVATYNGTLDTITCNGSALTITKVDSRLFRVSGSITGVTRANFVATGSASNIKFSILQLNVSIYSLMAYNDTGFFAVSGSAYQYMADANTAKSYKFGLGLGSDLLKSFDGYLYVNGKSKYDYIDVFFSIKFGSFSSIRCSLDDVAIPYEITYLNGTVESDSYVLSDGQNYQDVHNQIYQGVIVRLDLRGIDRTSTAYPCIEFHGQYNDAVMATFTLEKVTGLIAYEPPSPIFAYFSDLKANLKIWFGDVVAALDGNTSSGDDFKEDSSGLISGLGDISASMDSVQRPSMNTINTDYAGDISDASTLMAALFTEATSVAWVSRIILASITIGLMSYILYGKE